MLQNVYVTWQIVDFYAKAHNHRYYSLTETFGPVDLASPSQIILTFEKTGGTLNLLLNSSNQLFSTGTVAVQSITIFCDDRAFDVTQLAEFKQFLISIKPDLFIITLAMQVDVPMPIAKVYSRITNAHTQVPELSDEEQTRQLQMLYRDSL